MYFSTKSVDTLRAIGKSPKTTTSSPPGRSLTAAKRQLLPILNKRRVGVAMWAFFAILSGVMVWHNLFIRSWGIGTFPSFARYAMCIKLHNLRANIFPSRVCHEQAVVDTCMSRLVLMGTVAPDDVMTMMIYCTANGREIGEFKSFLALDIAKCTSSHVFQQHYSCKTQPCRSVLAEKYSR